MTLAFVEDIFVYTSSPRSLYLNPEAPDWITVDEKYKPILDLVDGKNDDSALYDHINHFYSDEKDVLTSQMQSLLATSRIFKHNQNQGQDNCMMDNGLGAPKSIYLTLTDSCNLKCIYCYATERKKHENATLETWKNYVADIMDFAGKPAFTFTGGEPLLVPYVLALAAYIKERGGECLLLTNGTLIDTAEKAAKIAELFGMVKISLDTLDEGISKTLRGQGVVEKARKAIDLLSAQKCNVQVQATITSKTHKNLDTFAAAFNHQVHFQPLYRDMGRARSKEDLSISGVQYFNALKSNGIFINLSGFHQNIHGYRNNPYKRCALAKEELSVDSDGNVFPCHMLHFESLVCGNLKKESISDIYRNSPVLNEMRTVNVDTVPKCKVCVFRNICGGACRARVDIVKDGIKGADSFCTFEQESILDALLYSYG
ncbi:MAG: radical SAM protein [Treponema sp.]|jgi:radical SAM protein with 4Fe4S-binding SPASM domain|nr:radical SAM protein [Treponema sp.]